MRFPCRIAALEGPGLAADGEALVRYSSLIRVKQAGGRFDEPCREGAEPRLRRLDAANRQRRCLRPDRRSD